jgi:DNA-binding transcriptional ArsR family regulator
VFGRRVGPESESNEGLSFRRSLACPSRSSGPPRVTMSRFFPTQADRSVDREAEPSVLYVDDEQTDRILSVLGADTALRIFRLLADRPLPASEIAEELELSIQNASYHLRKLQDAGLIEVVDTCYSEKGREMDIYAASSDPKVLILGTEADDRGLRKAFEQLSAAVGVPALVLAAWRSVADATGRLLDA